MTKFNTKQAEALDPNIINKNVLISAGAGSGKTAVLTEKVYNLITRDGVNIDELLVLTFTDAASFGMKEKIINRTRQDNPELANRLYSAHISTFDSFTSFLVKKYSDRLNVNPNFKIIDEKLISAKKEEFIEEILEKHYEAKDPELINALETLCFKDDKNLKELIKKLDEFLCHLSTKDYNEFINNYDKYLDINNINSKYNELLEEIYKKIFKLGDYFYKGNFEDDDAAKIGFDETLNTLNNYKKAKENGWNSFYSMLISYKLPFSKNCNKYKKMKIRTKFAFDNVFQYLNDLGKDLLKYPSPSEEAAKFIRNKDLHHFIIKIYKELKEKTDEYKFVSSSYTFQDISLLTLKLISDSQFEDIQEEITNTFKYCLVDEYQDTNDIQEEFLKFINKKAKLFVVGDIKQSIYKFRNANPSLFKDRKSKYNENKDENKVIDMNTNYRSFKKVLDYCNIFFEKNMSLDKGDVEFNDNEKLHYDTSINLYDENQLIKGNHYGLNVLSGNITHKDIIWQEKSPQYEEALIIINDILDKIRNKYQVLEKNDHGKLIFRDCNFGDFAILTQRKTNFGVFKELFSTYNIPLNIVIEDNIRDINSVITLESLINFYIDIKNNRDSKKLRFDFASLARSYLFFDGDDESIFNILKDQSNKKIKESPIYLKMEKFVKIHKDESISEVFNALINEFDVFPRLEKIGEVDNNLNKIESFYEMIKSLEDGGKTIEEFASLLESLNKHKIELGRKNLIKNDKSVELTTIHASKGLEYKIVYLSCAESSYSYKNKDNINIVTKEYGMLLDEHKKNAYKTSLFQKIYKDKDKNEDYSEYVRLIYVALTRAKENLYFVNPFSYGSRKESKLAELLRNAFTVKIRFNKELFNKVNELVGSPSLESDINYLLEYYNTIMDDDCLKNPQSMHKINDFSFASYCESLTESLLLKTMIGPFKDKFTSEYDANNLKKKDALKVDESNIDIFRNLAKGLINIISFRLSSFYILKLFSDEIFVKEFVESNIDVNFINHYLFKVKKAMTSANSKLKEEDLLLFIKLRTNKEYLPLFEYYFKDDNITIKNLNSDQKIEAFGDKKESLPDLKISIGKIEFKQKKLIKASHQVEDPEIYKSGILKEGIKLHKLLELVDFKSKNTSFIKDNKDRIKIDNVLKLNIFSDLENATIFKEYEYLEDDQKGIIDLLIIFKDRALIIDYKTKDIDEDKYKDQLETYKRNVERIFNIHNIKTYLISINDGILKEVI